MRAMAFSFPEDPHIWDEIVEHQYCFGSELLVAPVYSGPSNQRHLYLPFGDWLDFWTGQVYHGGTDIRVQAELDHIPVFARAGAVIPWLDPSPELAHTLTDVEITNRLNQDNVLTAKGKLWTPRRVMDFRRTNQISSTFVCKTQNLRSNERVYLSSAEAAERLGISQVTVTKWYRLGLLSGKRKPGHSTLWIQLNEDVEYRLKGGAAPDPRMLNIRELCQTGTMSRDQIFAWAQSEGYKIFRIQVGDIVRFYILPAESSMTQL